MNWWTLLIFVTLTWLLWVVGGTIGLWADIRERKRPQNSTFSIMPIFPVFPLIFFGGAMLLNLFIPPWGTRIVGAFHAFLIAVFLVVITRDLFRGRSAGPFDSQVPSAPGRDRE